jgi:hypothetical protein
MHTIALHHILFKSTLLAEDLAKELDLGADKQNYTGLIRPPLKPVGDKPKLAISDGNVLLVDTDESAKDDKITA